MVSLGRTVFLWLSNLLLPIAIIVFSTGFFPYKPFLPGLAKFPKAQDASPKDVPFDKIVFMVVDALRSDFVYSNTSGFEFTQSLVRSGAALPFTAHASSPTITMPRVKAITTGSVPSFLDVILNFAESDTTSTLAHQDTWLAQIRAHLNGRLVMYGDDTWLKLFPGFFERSDGTSSFFVSDFTEVDNNVTRHVPDELGQADWSAMILHYLGLDHIGHKSGPRSPHMIPKQSEMDGIVHDIYRAFETKEHLKSCLLVLCGDHGMNEAGNHGGSAAGETSTALVFISPKLKRHFPGTDCPAEFADDFQYYDVVEQSDIAPTLAGLLDFPIPLNNLGVFIPQLLELWHTDSEKADILARNERQILEVTRATFPDWTGQQRNSPGDLEATLSKLREAQELMSSAASSYDLGRLGAGVLIAGVAALFAVAASFQAIFASGNTGLAFVAVTLSYGAMVFASSYVEEEQHFWYWMASGWLALLYFKEGQKADSAHASPGVFSLVIASIFRLLRRWNQTGQKFAGEVDIASHFLPKHNQMFWALVLLTYVSVSQRICQRIFSKRKTPFVTPVAIGTCVAAFLFKVSFTFADAPELFKGSPLLTVVGHWMQNISLVNQARTIFVGLGLLITSVWFADRKHDETSSKETASSFHDLLTLFLMTQSRAVNIPIFLFMEVQRYLLGDLDLSSSELTMTSFLLQQASFYLFGGSNAISSIDLSNAYNGVSGYNVLAVGILTFVSNWAGPIWWVSATHTLRKRDRLQQQQHGSRDQAHLAFLTLFVTSSLLATMVACTALRAHLFIWTVFSPKFLYTIAWSVAHHLVINVVFGGFLLPALFG